MTLNSFALLAYNKKLVTSFGVKAAFTALMITAINTSIVITSTTPAVAQEAVFEGKDKWLFAGWEKIDNIDNIAVDNSLDLIAFASAELARHDIALISMIVPSKAIIHQDKLPEGLNLPADIIGLNDTMQKRLAEKEVTSVDIFTSLKNLPQEEQAFFRSDFHWTGWGSEAAAKTVAEVIKDKWSLKGKAGDGAKLGEWTKERRFGDLAVNFMTPAQRDAIGREVFTVRKDPPAETLSLLDDAAAPVHVVGNSFTEPYLGFSQALSYQLDRNVTLTWNPGDVGPWATMLQYLGSDAFKQNPPQVNVWQFNEGQLHQGPSTQGQWIASSIISDTEWKQHLQTYLINTRK